MNEREDEEYESADPTDEEPREGASERAPEEPPENAEDDADENAEDDADEDLEDEPAGRPGDRSIQARRDARTTSNPEGTVPTGPRRGCRR